MKIVPYQLPFRRRSSTATLLLSLGLALGGCAVQPPSYNQALFDGLKQVNRDSMRLLATVSGGVTRETFPTREGQYDDVIGEVDALALEAAARPAPQPPGEFMAALRKRFGGGAAGTPAKAAPAESPTTTSLQRISGILVEMKSTDQKQGITPPVAGLFKRRVNLAMSRALAYESTLAP